MTRNKPSLPDLTDAEEAAIQAGIARDPDNPELTDEQLASMRPARSALPRDLYEALAKRGRGRPRLDPSAKKAPVKLRVDPDALDAFKAGGPGWQTRMNEALKQAAIIGHCIFCDNELTPNTKAEHILLNALGGRKTTRRVICSDCNERFGQTIDKSLTSQVDAIRNMLQLESGERKPPPMLRGIRGGEERVNFRSDGTPELVGKPFNVEKRGDGSFTVQITTKSKEDLQRLIPHIAAQIGCPAKELMAILEQGEVSFTARRPGTAHHRFIFGGPEALRSVMKSCLVLWSTVVGNEELKSDPYGEARQFVVAGDESFSQRRIHLDSRHLPCVEELKTWFGHLFNLIYVKSDSAGRVVGHFTLYNAIGWQLVLAESGGSPNISIGLISNPLNPAEWSDTIANEVDIDFDWLSCPALPDFIKARERFNSIVEQHFNRRRPRELENIVDDVCERHGISGDDPIPDALQEQIFSEVSERAALLIHNLPYKRALSRAEIKDLLKGI